MARVPLLQESQMDPMVVELLRDRPPLNLYKVLAHAPNAANGLLTLGRSILALSSLDPVVREVAIVRTGVVCEGHYELTQHRRVARLVGMSAEKIDAIENDPGSALLTEAERAVIDFTDQFVARRKADDSVYERLAVHFSPRQQIELMSAIGFYFIVSRLCENLEIELEGEEVDLKFPRR